MQGRRYNPRLILAQLPALGLVEAEGGVSTLSGENGVMS